VQLNTFCAGIFLSTEDCEGQLICMKDNHIFRQVR